MKTVKLFEKRACKKVISSLVKGPHMFTEKPEEERIASHDAFFQKHHAISQS